ncbi:amino acid permease [Gemmatimonadota bacterium]
MASGREGSSTAPHVKRLHKQLTLFDVYVITTGAMFSSGFFLLPGLATAAAGPSVVLAYLLSAFLIVPAMLSQAELATAMPRAGGAYFFLDRAFGPLVGTVSGLGTWLALILKSAFALIGMGAYLAIFFDVPIKLLAIAIVVVFAILNVVGTKGSTTLVRWLVFGLLAILGMFVFHGLAEVVSQGPLEIRRRFTPFMPHGVDGLLGTVGLVFISYMGLTKVAGLAEEVTNPDRNIPLGMALSLGTVTIIYVVGTYIMVAVLGTDVLSSSLTPVADTAEAFVTWIPPRAAVLVIAVAAIAAFTAMANTGILASSRYPLAMARDALIPERFGTIGRFRTPWVSIVTTCTTLVLCLVLLDVVEVAKLASTLQLLLFGLINLAVIAMRESKLDSYDPGFRSPLYPWMQMAGIILPFILIGEMGWLPVLFSIGVAALSVGWYTYYARGQLARTGVVYHVFERMGRARSVDVDRQWRDMLKQMGSRAADSFEEVVGRAFVVDERTQSASLDPLIIKASRLLSRRLPVTPRQLAEGFVYSIQQGDSPVEHGAAILHTRLPHVDGAEMVLVRCLKGIQQDTTHIQLVGQAGTSIPIRAVFLLVGDTTNPGRHIRILGQLCARIQDGQFMGDWMGAANELALRRTVVSDDRFLALQVESGTRTEPLINVALVDFDMPKGTLVAMVNRRGETLVPRGHTVLLEGDHLAIIGNPSGIQDLTDRFGTCDAPDT